MLVVNPGFGPLHVSSYGMNRNCSSWEDGISNPVVQRVKSSLFCIWVKDQGAEGTSRNLRDIEDNRYLQRSDI